MQIEKYVPLINFSVFIISVIIHELAHGYAAYWSGDPTAKNQGRLSFSPIKHADLIGTILLPIVLVVFGSPAILGWAKPVPVNFTKLSKRKKLFVASAGIIANIGLALIGLGLYFATRGFATPDASLATQLICLAVFMFLPINLILAAFNALPIPPLFDGWVIMAIIVKNKVSFNKIFNTQAAMVVSFIAAAAVIRVLFKPIIAFVRYITQMPPI